MEKLKQNLDHFGIMKEKLEYEATVKIQMYIRKDFLPRMEL